MWCPYLQCRWVSHFSFGLLWPFLRAFASLSRPFIMQSWFWSSLNLFLSDKSLRQPNAFWILHRAHLLPLVWQVMEFLCLLNSSFLSLDSTSLFFSSPDNLCLDFRWFMSRRCCRARRSHQVDLNLEHGSRHSCLIVVLDQTLKPTSFWLPWDYWNF